MSETKPPSIPDISDSNLVAAARRIKNLLEIREGRAGNPVDGFVTFRDLVRLGLGKVRDGSTTISGFKRLPVTALPFLDPNSYDGTRDFTKPPTPTGLAAAAIGSVVILTWSILTYPNHDYFEVWRSETDDLTKATMIGSPVGTVFTDPAGENRVYFYWVRAVSMAAVHSSYNSMSGTSVATGAGAGGGTGGTADSTLEAQIVTLGEGLQSQIDSLTQSLSALTLRVYDLEAWKAQAMSQLNMLMVQFQNHANRLAALEANSRVTGRRTRTERLLLTSTLADRAVLRGMLSEALALADNLSTPSGLAEALSLGDSYTGDVAP